MQARLGEVDLALEECRKAIALLQEITGDGTQPAPNLRAETYEYLGYAYAALAASPKASASESRQHMSAARDQFRQTLNSSTTCAIGASWRRNEEWAKDNRRARSPNATRPWKISARLPTDRDEEGRAKNRGGR